MFFKTGSDDLVKARDSPWGLRSKDLNGVPLFPTGIANAVDDRSEPRAWLTQFDFLSIDFQHQPEIRPNKKRSLRFVGFAPRNNANPLPIRVEAQNQHRTHPQCPGCYLSHICNCILTFFAPQTKIQSEMQTERIMQGKQLSACYWLLFFKGTNSTIT